MNRTNKNRFIQRTNPCQKERCVLTRVLCFDIIIICSEGFPLYNSFSERMFDIMNDLVSKNAKRQKDPFSSHGKVFLLGVRDGIPIGLGYLAVSFSLGVAAGNAGLTWFQGFIFSLFMNASAGENAGFIIIGSNASYIEAILMTVVANARYLLMSCNLSQRFSKETPLYQRMILGFDLTDELFGITIARDGNIDPFYTYGAMASSMPCWAVGTALGIVMGNILPLRLVSALSVALYGMFIAVIIPPAKKDKIVGVCIIFSFAASFAASVIPLFSEISESVRIIVLTVIISAAAALIFPKKDDEKEIAAAELSSTEEKDEICCMMGGNTNSTEDNDRE